MMPARCSCAMRCKAQASWLPEQADLIALSAHKLYGPKGIGALWVRDGVKIAELIHGGGQEGGLRSGTLSPALCAGFGAAAALAAADGAGFSAPRRTCQWRARALSPAGRSTAARPRAGPAISICGWMGSTFPRLMSDCRELAFSAGSACASGTGAAQPRARAIGLEPGRRKPRSAWIWPLYDYGGGGNACRTIECGGTAQGV
jgi:cysteine desulfurase